MINLTRSSIIAVATFGCVTLSAVISLVWLITAHGAARFEPAVSGLGLLGGLAGILAERRAAAQERRHLALLTLMDELRRDAEILADPQFSASRTTPTPRVYPRLPVSATDATLISGSLAEQADADLLSRLHKWRDEVNGFNRRLEITENIIFTAETRVEVADFERMLYRSDSYLNQVRLHLHELLGYMITCYDILDKAADSMPGNGSPTPKSEIIQRI